MTYMICKKYKAAVTISTIKICSSKEELRSWISKLDKPQYHFVYTFGEDGMVAGIGKNARRWLQKNPAEG